MYYTQTMFIRHKKTVSHENQYILWVGSLLKLSDLDNGLTASTAAVRWQTGLAGGVLDADLSIHCINKPGGLYWPHASFVLGRKSPQFYRGISGEETRFINIPKIRTSLASRAYLSALKRTIEEFGNPNLAVFYNITVQNVKMFYRLKYKHNVPCIVLAADIPEKNNREYIIYDNACKDADGVIYLSRSEFLKSSLKNKIHMEGGISQQILHDRLNNVPDAKPYFMYTGAFLNYCGVELILDALEKTNNDFQLVICGTCKNKKLLAQFKKNPRVDYKGYVSEEKLGYLSQYALAFINSYLPSAPECEGKFPSKLFEYLSYGRPVVSTLTTGISPEYKDILYVVNEEDAGHMAMQLDAVFDLYKSGGDAQIQKNKLFLKSRTWEHQTKRFFDFIRQCQI